MDHALHTKIVSFIWGIADDVLRNLLLCARQILRCDLTDDRDAPIAFCSIANEDSALAYIEQRTTMVGAE